MAPRKESTTDAKRRKTFATEVKRQKIWDEQNNNLKSFYKPGGKADQIKRRSETNYKGSGVGNSSEDTSDIATTKSRGPNKASKTAPKKPSMPNRAADTVNIKKIGNY